MANVDNHPLVEKHAIDSDRVFYHGLSWWGTNASFQVRDGDLAVHFMEYAERSTENGNPYILSAFEARKLRDLLNVATARGFL